eukprot:558942-Prymnesium_polylepis.1
MEALAVQYEIASSAQEAPSEPVKPNDRDAEYQKGFADMMKVCSAQLCSFALRLLAACPCMPQTKIDWDTIDLGKKIGE